MKLGSLFDGIGGFPYSAQKYGITPVWASEIEEWPIKITQKHFPNMKHLGDITKIDGAGIEPVDIITFGSPCTRLSVAGRHDGFDITFKCTGEKDNPHEVYSKTIRAINKYQYKYTDKCPFCGQELSETNESALFFHAIRIINEMRDATNDKYPRFAVWENVPGAFSSNKGQDFRTVLEEIAETEIPMPKSGKWANAGMVRTSGVDIAWRVLDAQYWGVPQRRKRIFLVADFGGQCAGEILFIEEGLRGDLAESGEKREETAGTVGDSIKKSSTIHMREGCAGGGKGPLISEEKSLTLGTSNDQVLFESHPMVIEPRSADGVPRWNTEGIVPTLNTSQGGQRQPCVISLYTGNVNQNGFGYREGASFTVDTTSNNAVAFTPSCFGNYQEGIGTLRANGGDLGGGSETLLISKYAVRRLTPLECLRLLGFPDYWLDIEGMSDTQKYKATGNSVAIPCVDFIMQGVAFVLKGSGQFAFSNRNRP